MFDYVCLFYNITYNILIFLSFPISYFQAMHRERERQIAAGKLTGDDKYVSPKIDSY